MVLGKAVTPLLCALDGEVVVIAVRGQPERRCPVSPQSLRGGLLLFLPLALSL